MSTTGKEVWVLCRSLRWAAAADALEEARGSGVRVLAYHCEVTLEAARITEAVEVLVDE